MCRVIGGYTLAIKTYNNERLAQEGRSHTRIQIERFWDNEKNVSYQLAAQKLMRVSRTLELRSTQKYNKISGLFSITIFEVGNIYHGIQTPR